MIAAGLVAPCRRIGDADARAYLLGNRPFERAAPRSGNLAASEILAELRPGQAERALADEAAVIEVLPPFQRGDALRRIENGVAILVIEAAAKLCEPRAEEIIHRIENTGIAECNAQPVRGYASVLQFFGVFEHLIPVLRRRKLGLLVHVHVVHV